MYRRIVTIYDMDERDFRWVLPKLNALYIVACDTTLNEIGAESRLTKYLSPPMMRI